MSSLIFVDEGANGKSQQPLGPAVAETWGGTGAPEVKLHLAACPWGVVLLGSAKLDNELGIVKGLEVVGAGHHPGGQHPGGSQRSRHH